MARSSIAKLSRAAFCSLRTSTTSVLPHRSSAALLNATKPAATAGLVVPARKLFTTSAVATRGIMPDTDDPKVPETPKEEVKTSVVELSDADYHELADTYLETVLTKLEELQDAREGVDVEYAVRCKHPPFLRRKPFHKSLHVTPKWNPQTGPGFLS